MITHSATVFAGLFALSLALCMGLFAARRRRAASGRWTALLLGAAGVLFFLFWAEVLLPFFLNSQPLKVLAVQRLFDQDPLVSFKW
ncbi:MAG: hypothetical protein AB1921_02420, partial [Thermodesulfobacteriota bacterium]